ncbi:AmmeMemoRadiSam system protein B [Roseateles oligotrophus]|uniref:MEMO1 family protein LNV07_17735 n=1 Tax=Roseateles oligotrophus TaxID=1769250 RepID=A0ABT2YIR2_9BURK|nr:AmmeMemoRadiSam system protein B [Roseateles oligotrophus]MCV2369928.1 AmmeMemoRadiSam system protein B [Roseateles oligotrophus]
MNTSTRPAAVAGAFYPAEPQALRGLLDRQLSSVAPPSEPRPQPQPHPRPKMLLVPHAGYVYSGEVAAAAFATLPPWREQIERVVLLGPAHRLPVRGIALPTVSAFETPLGRIPLDLDAMALLKDLPQIESADPPHAQEHSLEVQLPFLQRVLGDGFKLLPLLVGGASPAQVAQALERVWGGDETLVLISSDLSHFLSYEQAHARDRVTVERILQFATDLVGEQACGAAPLNGALALAARHGLRPRLLRQRNSGDIPGGEHRRVVGYVSIAFEADPAAPALLEQRSADQRLGPILLSGARHTIAHRLGLPGPPAPDEGAHPALSRPGASFVSLHDAGGQLRGCVGRLQAQRPLIEDVCANAFAAAFCDSRFAPLRAEEWPGLQVEVSLLEPAEPMPVQDEAEALAALRPGIDGLILAWRDRQATFLPQVWAQCPRPAQFLAALKHKAGLPPDFWAADLRLSRYRVRCFNELAYASEDAP